MIAMERETACRIEAGDVLMMDAEGLVGPPSFWANRRTDFRDADLDGAEPDPVAAARIRLERMSKRTREVIARSDAVMLETRRLVTEIRQYAAAVHAIYGG